MSDKNFTNRLLNEKSPYLLQHAQNPVDWYPWSDEAFNKAKAEDKPIFLSIGYSTCHWCHVMAHESFEDEGVASILNKNFICIKVDKEERPDIDSVYMNVCQSLTGSGGWPLTIIMTPDQKPFYAATYLPKTSRYQMVGLIDLLTEVTRLWTVGKKELVLSSEEIVNHIAENKPVKSTEMKKDLIMTACDMYLNSFDFSYGGFGNAPKFPSPHNLMFLLRYSVLENDKQSLQMVEKTLESMYRGGIFDHIGGGFSRYSTDDRWLVPHFEKMLYDNALLAIIYLEAYQLTNRQLYKTVAERTLDYIINEMTDEKGGFYSAQDADSEGVEGKYYVFTSDEIVNILGEDDGSYFCEYFNVTPKGNFEGKNILNLINKDDIDYGDSKIRELSKKLYDYRINRTKLHKDDKILTSWNSLMIVAFSKAARILNRSDYESVAVRAYDFTEQYLTNNDGDLCVRYRDDMTAGKGFLDDYAFTVWALISLYETTFNEIYLTKSVDFCNKMIDKFYDENESGFFLYDKSSEALISRPKEIYDGAIPSGNSVASYVLQRLSQFTDNQRFADLSEKQLQFLAGSVNNYPIGISFGLISGMRALYPSSEIVCVSKDKSDLNEFRNLLSKNFIPNITPIYKNLDGKITEIIPYTADYNELNNNTTYYLCKNHACMSPTNDMNIIEENLKNFNKEIEHV